MKNLTLLILTALLITACGTSGDKETSKDSRQSQYLDPLPSGIKAQLKHQLSLMLAM